MLTEKSPRPIGTDVWLNAIGHKLSIPRATLYDWWQSFCEESGLTLMPRHALAPHKVRFFVWLEGHQRQSEAAY